MKEYKFNKDELFTGKLNTLALLTQLQAIDPDIALSINMGGEIRRNGVAKPLEPQAVVFASDSTPREAVLAVLKAHSPQLDDAEAQIETKKTKEIERISEAILSALDIPEVKQAIKAKLV